MAYRKRCVYFLDPDDLNRPLRPKVREVMDEDWRISDAGTSGLDDFRVRLMYVSNPHMAAMTADGTMNLGDVRSSTSKNDNTRGNHAIVETVLMQSETDCFEMFGFLKKL